MVWVSPLPDPGDLPPFEPFPPLGEPPVMAPTLLPALPPTLPPFATLPPTLPPGLPPTAVAPAPPPGLVVGGTAVVQTTAGDHLRARTGPGIGYPVLFLLANGTPVTLREGPVAAGGYSWWRVETGDGRAGWAVDGVPERVSGWLHTLIRAGG